MPERVVKIPGPDHPITVLPHAGLVRVVAGGKVVAETTRALALREAAYPVVFYVPREDADLALLERSQHASWCPYKGEASYFSIPGGGERAVNAVWSYEQPHAAVAAIAGHLAFYPDRVDAIEAHGL
ncbi:MAG: DUF427 domain-containing protein [Caulobacter sp.]|nr:DUF427 domain-containing protein [Caulobacter sp.]